MMKHTAALFSLCLLSLTGAAQGIINNGAHIVMNGAAYIYMDNAATAGHYLSQAGGIIDNAAVGGTMYIPNDWINNAGNNGFSNDGTGVAFYGTTQSIGGSSSTIFYTIYCINVGNKTLNINTSVGGQNLYNGQLVLGVNTHPLDLNGYRLDITNPLPTGISVATGYIISETNASLNPSIVRWYTGTNTGTYSIPFGASGQQFPFDFNITAAMPAGTDYVEAATRPTASTANTPWASTVTHMFDPNLGQDGSDEAVIDRWWELTFSGAATADLTFRYRGTENTLQVPYNTGNLGAQWWATGWFPNNANIGSSPAVLAGVGSVNAPGISFVAGAYTPMVLSAVNAPLPIELTNFTVNCNGNQVLSWSTASEINNDYFTVQRSDDGVSFRDIGQVNGAGTSSQLHNYSFIDPQPVSGIAYYRLKQTDFNGASTFSKIVAGATCGDMNDYIDAYNSGNGITITVNVGQATDYTVTVFDDRGRIMINRGISAAEGANNFLLDGIIPATGVYLVKVTGNDGRSFTKRLFLAVE